MPVTMLNSPAAGTLPADPPPPAAAEASTPVIAAAFNPPLSRTVMPRWLAWLWYEFAYWITMAVFTLGFSLRMSGRRNIPRHGPALLIANHQSFFDPLVIGAASPRQLCFLARKTLFHNRIF